MITRSTSLERRVLNWAAYKVSQGAKAPLLNFIVDALVAHGCSIISATPPTEAPFYIVFETPSGERHGVLAYAFFANARATRNRPEDEHRFQVKYGNNLKAVLDVAMDASGLVTTLFLGIDTERGIFVAADPLMNTPAPMSRSIEFKRENVEEVMDVGWAAWERERRPKKSQDRRGFVPDEDIRTEVLVGGRQRRLLDLIFLERAARGLDPGERHLLADKMREEKRQPGAPHKLLEEVGMGSDALLDLIAGARRLKMAVRGWVAEAHLEAALRATHGVTDCRRIEEEGKPDITLRWRGGPPILIECKNTLRKTDAQGRPKVDFMRTRAAMGDPCSRYYQPADFAVLAACLHAVTEKWEFQYALTRELPPHKACEGRISNRVLVEPSVFSNEPAVAFSKCS